MTAIRPGSVSADLLLVGMALSALCAIPLAGRASAQGSNEPPFTLTTLNADAAGMLPLGRNDFGVAGYGGACPPPGQGHQYRFAVWALREVTIPFAAGTPDGKVGDYLKAHALGEADLTFSYKR